MALVRQIIVANLKNITVIASGYALDILIASGCVKKTVSYLAAGGWGQLLRVFERPRNRER